MASHGKPWLTMMSGHYHAHTMTLESNFDALTLTHCIIPDNMWNAIHGDGYCGYAALRRMLFPHSSKFVVSDPSKLADFRDFLQSLAPTIPDEMPEVTGRVKAAVHLLGSHGDYLATT